MSRPRTWLEWKAFIVWVALSGAVRRMVPRSIPSELLIFISGWAFGVLSVVAFSVGMTHVQ